MSSHLYQQRKGEGEQPAYLTRIGDRHFKIDLAKMPGKGNFPCPGCETEGYETDISPKDWTDEHYRIVDDRKVDGQLVELMLHCNKCRSRLVLTGFV